MHRHIWIVDDEPAICWALRKALEGQGYHVQFFSSAETFFSAIAKPGVPEPRVIFLDVRLPGLSGIEVLNRLQQTHPHVPVILMTAFGDLKIAVDAIKNKAFEYLTKPFPLDAALLAAERAMRVQDSRVHDTLPTPELPVDAVLGTSTIMQELYKQIALAASNDWPVLVSGEQGVGKSTVARLIHLYGKRREQPLLTFRPHPDDPFECLSELYGIEAEANVEAEAPSGERLARPHHVRPGLLRLASSGSVVVEEVTLLPLNVQARLLESLESHAFVAVSSNRQQRLTARLIFTSSSHLEPALTEGELYPQFYAHLQVHTVHVPTLAEHREDIPLLVRAALQQATAGEPYQITDRALLELQRRPWRGNIRELYQVVHKAAVNASGALIDIDSLPPTTQALDHGGQPSETTQQLDTITRRWIGQHLPARDSDRSEGSPGFLYEQCLDVVERAIIEAVLNHTQGNRASAAELLGLHRTTLRQKAKRLGID